MANRYFCTFNINQRHERPHRIRSRKAANMTQLMTGTRPLKLQRHWRQRQSVSEKCIGSDLPPKIIKGKTGLETGGVTCRHFVPPNRADKSVQKLGLTHWVQQRQLAAIYTARSDVLHNCFYSCNSSCAPATNKQSDTKTTSEIMLNMTMCGFLTSSLPHYCQQFHHFLPYLLRVLMIEGVFSVCTSI
jgi:hypothetical protein